MPSLPDPIKIVSLELRNRIVMAPMIVEKATREGLVIEERARLAIDIALWFTVLIATSAILNYRRGKPKETSARPQTS